MAAINKDFVEKLAADNKIPATQTPMSAPWRRTERRLSKIPPGNRFFGSGRPDGADEEDEAGEVTWSS